MHEQARKAISYCSWFKGTTNWPTAPPSRRVQECNTLTKPEFVMAKGGVGSEKGTSEMPLDLPVRESGDLHLTFLPGAEPNRLSVTGQVQA